MKKLYKQFNRLSMDIEVEPMEVSELEKERIKQNVRKQKKSRLPRTLSVAIVAVVTLLAFSLTVGMTNPAFAAKLPIIGNIFDLFKEDNKEYIFEEYSDHATGIGATQESNGVSITITDAVYDKESITISYTMKSEEPLGEEPFLDGEFLAVEYDKQMSYTPGRFMTEKVNENEYAGIYIHYLMNGKKHDQVNVQWNGERIRRSSDKQEGKPIEGNWSFEFTLDALEVDMQEFDSLTSESEFVRVTLQKMTTTPVSTNFYLKKILDRNSEEWEEEWETASIDYSVSDNLGNEYNMMYNAGYGDSRFVMSERFSTTVLHDEATSITITPVVSIYKLRADSESESGTDLELVMEPFELEPIEVSLER